MKKFKTFTLFFFLCMGTLFAQTPGAFNYQAVLRNADGQVNSNQATSIRISVLSGTAEGDVVYQETHSPTISTMFWHIILKPIRMKSLGFTTRRIVIYFD
jgi:hypothetical protein